jgi:hypothetical protein
MPLIPSRWHRCLNSVARSPSTPVLMYTGRPPEDRSCLDLVIQKSAHIWNLIPTVTRFSPDNSGRMKEFCGMAKIVSQIVSHGADHPPNSLPHRQLEMEAEVGIGRLKRHFRSKNA